MKRALTLLAAGGLATGALLLAGVVTYSGTFGLNLILRRES